MEQVSYKYSQGKDNWFQLSNKLFERMTSSDKTLYTLLTCLQIIMAIRASNNYKCDNLKSAATNEKFNLVYEWQYINFTWPSARAYEEAIRSKFYIPENNIILGVKYYNDKIYLALPKAKPGAPVSIGYIPKYPTTETKNNPLITPFPNWETYQSDDCSVLLQDLQSFEIDSKGIMWVIDGRRVDNLPKKCPPRIVLLDLNQNGKVVESYILPPEICSHESCFLNDLVVDEVNGGYAYITDSSLTDPGLIIYSRKENRAWKARDKTMFAEKDAMNFTSHGVMQSKSNNVNGIALSVEKPNRKLYYTALSAFTLYAIPTEVLKDESLATGDVGEFVENVGNKTGQSSGAIVDTKGQLYYGLIAEDTILRWNTSEPFTEKQIIEKNPGLIPYPDSYTFDDEGYMYLMATNVDRFSAGYLNTEEFNFKLSKLYTGTCSYIQS